jgi:hypothetical protein
LRETNDDSVNAIMKLTKWDVMCINFMTFRGICSFCWYFNWLVGRYVGIWI